MHNLQLVECTGLWLTRTVPNFTDYPVSKAVDLGDRNIPRRKLRPWIRNFKVYQIFQSFQDSERRKPSFQSCLASKFSRRLFARAPLPTIGHGVLSHPSVRWSGVPTHPHEFHIRATAGFWSSERLLMGNLYPLVKRGRDIFMWYYPGGINFDGNSLLSVYQPTGKPRCSFHSAAVAYLYSHFAGTSIG